MLTGNSWTKMYRHPFEHRLLTSQHNRPLAKFIFSFTTMQGASVSDCPFSLYQIANHTFFFEIHIKQAENFSNSIRCCCRRCGRDAWSDTTLLLPRFSSLDQPKPRWTTPLLYAEIFWQFICVRSNPCRDQNDGFGLNRVQQQWTNTVTAFQSLRWARRIQFSGFLLFETLLSSASSEHRLWANQHVLDFHCAKSASDQSSVGWLDSEQIKFWLFILIFIKNTFQLYREDLQLNCLHELRYDLSLFEWRNFLLSH
jgi:hypothetical protein